MVARMQHFHSSRFNTERSVKRICSCSCGTNARTWPQQPRIPRFGELTLLWLSPR